MKKFSQSRSSVTATKDVASDSGHVLISKALPENPYRALLTTAVLLRVHKFNKKPLPGRVSQKLLIRAQATQLSTETEIV